MHRTQAWRSGGPGAVAGQGRSHRCRAETEGLPAPARHLCNRKCQALRRNPQSRALLRQAGWLGRRFSAAGGGGGGASSSERSAEDRLDREILTIALPTIATLAADPVAALVSTAWVGQMGALELASVGVALSVYGAFTKLLNMPLLAVVTSSTATALGKGGGETSPDMAAAVSSALLLALLLGTLQAVLLLACGFGGLEVWGAGPSSALHANAAAYLSVRALSAPATVLFMALQGVFRGLGDTRAPLAAAVISNVINVLLEPLFIFTFGWGVRGAAGAIAAAQIVASGGLLFLLSRRVPLRAVGASAFTEAAKYLGPTGLLTLRSLAITGTYSIATGLAARTDPAHAAAHQVAFQLWLASSLLADSLAVAAQSILARSLAANGTSARADARLVVRRVISLSAGLGAALAAGLAAGSWLLPLPRLFTADAGVATALGLIFPAVVATQPVNALAFVLDGVLYGCGGFVYAAQAMVLAAVPAIVVMIGGSKFVAGAGPDRQLVVVWAGLATVMVMRIITIAVPLMGRQPPFDKLRRD